MKTNKWWDLKKKWTRPYFYQRIRDKTQLIQFWNNSIIEACNKNELDHKDLVMILGQINDMLDEINDYVKCIENPKNAYEIISARYRSDDEDYEDYCFYD